MEAKLPPPQAVNRLLAAMWDPSGLPHPTSVPWDEALRIVTEAGLIGTAYHVTKEVHWALPPEVLEQLRRGFHWMVAGNSRRLSQLAAVGKALDTAVGTGAPLLLLKGAALVDELYNNIGMRSMGDIDLAVAPEQVAACREALVGLGYTPIETEARQGTVLEYCNEEAFRGPDSFSTRVELHWHLFDLPYYMRRVPMSWFWDNSEIREIAGRPFRVLTVEANLVYLPAHLGLHHQFEGLHSLLDLALLIAKRGEQLDWDRVFAVAQGFELLSALVGTLDRLAVRWPQLPLDEPRRRIRELQPSPMDERLFRLGTSESDGTMLDFYRMLVSLPDSRARARYAWHNIFPQTEYMKRRYKVETVWQLPYWYLRRLADGAGQVVRNLPRVRRLDAGTGS